METNGNPGHSEDMYFNGERPKRSYFLGPDFSGKQDLMGGLKGQKHCVHDKDWSAYEYGTSNVNHEALKYENEIRLTLALGKIPVLIGLDDSSLPDDLQQLIKEGRIQVNLIEEKKDVTHLVSEILEQIDMLVGHKKTKNRGFITRMRLRL